MEFVSLLLWANKYLSTAMNYHEQVVRFIQKCCSVVQLYSCVQLYNCTTDDTIRVTHTVCVTHNEVLTAL